MKTPAATAAATGGGGCCATAAAAAAATGGGGCCATAAAAATAAAHGAVREIHSLVVAKGEHILSGNRQRSDPFHGEKVFKTIKSLAKDLNSVQVGSSRPRPSE